MPTAASLGKSREVFLNDALPAGTNNIGDVDIVSAIPAGTNNIGDVDVLTIAAGETHLGEVSSPRDVISVTPTVSVSPQYSAGDAVGGKQTLTSICRSSGGRVALETLTVVDKGDQKAVLEVLFFNADPSAATITDNAAFVFSTDISKVVARIQVAAADYVTVNTKAIATLRNLGVILEAVGSAHLYVAVVTSGTPTYASTSDLIFYYGFEQT